MGRFFEAALLLELQRNEERANPGVACGGFFQVPTSWWVGCVFFWFCFWCLFFKCPLLGRLDLWLWGGGFLAFFCLVFAFVFFWLLFCFGMNCFLCVFACCVLGFFFFSSGTHYLEF